MAETERVLKETTQPKQHTLTLDARKNLHMTGVTDVDSYDEHAALIHTVCGILCVEGEHLHVSGLSVETGELTLDGTVSALYYTEEAKSAGGGFFARLFR